MAQPQAVAADKELKLEPDMFLGVGCSLEPCKQLLRKLSCSQGRTVVDQNISGLLACCGWLNGDVS
jgi:hypothetical protein